MKMVRTYQEFHQWIREHGSPGVIIVTSKDYDVISNKFVHKNHHYTDEGGDFCMTTMSDNRPVLIRRRSEGPAFLDCPDPIPCVG